MRRRRRATVMALTFIAWLVGSSVYAYWYVMARIAAPDAVGYEQAWDWQLFFFCIARLPLLLILLFALLWAEYRLVPRR
jgi:hypothetical protein